MILIDANLLIYAHVDVFPFHEQAQAWLDDRLNSTAPVGLPWQSLLAFIRVVSNPRIFEKPESTAEAWHQIEEWLSCPSVWVPLPTERHQEFLKPFLLNQVSRPNLVPDAHLAALAVEHGLTLYSSDGDFARFPGLKWRNPLSDNELMKKCTP